MKIYFLTSESYFYFPNSSVQELQLELCAANLDQPLGQKNMYIIENKKNNVRKRNKPITGLCLCNLFSTNRARDTTALCDKKSNKEKCKKRAYKQVPKSEFAPMHNLLFHFQTASGRGETFVMGSTYCSTSPTSQEMPLSYQLVTVVLHYLLHYPHPPAQYHEGEKR